MTTVTLTIATVQQSFPTGTLGGVWDFVVKQAVSGTVIKHDTANTPTKIYTDLIPGDYVAEGKRLASTSAALGPTKSKPFTVPDPGVLIDVADDITVDIT